MHKLCSTVVAFALMALVPISLASPQQDSGRPEIPPLLADGLKAPDFAVVASNGPKVSLSSLKGKVVVLDFWASWCGPCQVSMPGLEKISRRANPKQVQVLSINTWDSEKDYRTWLKENQAKYHFNFVRDPAEGDHDTIRRLSIARKLYHAPGIPTVYVIGKDGKIVGSAVGSGNEERIEALLKTAGVKLAKP